MLQMNFPAEALRQIGVGAIETSFPRDELTKPKNRQSSRFGFGYNWPGPSWGPRVFFEAADLPSDGIHLPWQSAKKFGELNNFRFRRTEN